MSSLTWDENELVLPKVYNILSKELVGTSDIFQAVTDSEVYYTGFNTNKVGIDSVYERLP